MAEKNAKSKRDRKGGSDASLLDKLNEAEAASALRKLLDRHSELRSETEAAAGSHPISYENMFRIGTGFSSPIPETDGCRLAKFSAESGGLADFVVRIRFLEGKVGEQRENGMSTKRIGRNIPAKGLGLSKARLDELIEEAVVDANGESEQVSGFYTMLENDLRLPFETQILGVTASVESVDITGDDQLVAVCRKGKTEQRISLSELPLPSPPPDGAEWILAYRYWRTGAR